ncbi:MAG TPA: bifunctional ADP-dependent NAD(P)H-hydrate dehydratase/NAD(P)H-hydrate epimerase [Chloroflexi bacterium]|nr:bifunctional ADP-dependent NAD(P)H-hydrate dehydratase/NAD(P)H-hydrate epimerase [Chloroflexota bacterium]|tara:strand:- start:4463 stop:6109 length:1647 start_codon:yes stop_codon:yes gene_type:complete
MPKIVTVEQMHMLESEAFSCGVSYDHMMEMAGSAVFEHICERITDVPSKSFVVVTGPGNNGGDGFVVARLLAASGASVNVFTINTTDNNADNQQKALLAGATVITPEDDYEMETYIREIRRANVFIDAIFGTGARVPLKSVAAKMLRIASVELDGREVLRVAVDCPSGLDCDTGVVDDNTLYADVSITFGAAKIGQLIFPGANAVGELVLADIGWPSDLSALDSIQLNLASGADVGSMIPERSRDSHKGTFGTALVVAGSINYSGAAYLAAAGAYRVGAGLVTVAVPGIIHGIVASQLPEATYIILPSDMGVISDSGVSILRQAFEKVDSLLLGPGWGTERPTADFIHGIFSSVQDDVSGGIGFAVKSKGNTNAEFDIVQLPPTVVDADGLRLLADLPEWYLRLPENSILTPHPGEMAFLTGLSIDDIQSDRIGMASRFAAEWGHIIVLKGAFTVVATPEGDVSVNPFATSALACAGTGDVLAGVIAGLLAQGMQPYQAAIVGTFLHGLAGTIALSEVGTTASVLASDVLDMTSKAISSVMSRVDYRP